MRISDWSSDVCSPDRKADAKPAAKTADKPAAAAKSTDNAELSPAGRRVAEQHGIDAKSVEGTGRRGQVTKEDLVRVVKGGGARPEERVPMTRIRKRIAARLLQSKNSIAKIGRAHV